MITPKPRSVFELFDGHPERWTKGLYSNTDNTCFCLDGAICYVYGEHSCNWSHPKVVEIKQMWTQLTGREYVTPWNDAYERTFEEVLAKVKELGI